MQKDVTRRHREAGLTILCFIICLLSLKIDFFLSVTIRHLYTDAETVTG